MKSRFHRVIAGALIVCLGAITVPAPAFAGIVSTDTVIAGAERTRLAGMLERVDVQARLQALGVDPADARARVAALSDEEAARLSAELDQLPAGGDALGVILVVFLVLLFTDIMGYTKIFPFTRPAR